MKKKSIVLALGGALVLVAIGALWAWNRFSAQYEESTGPISVSPVKTMIPSDPDDFATIVFVVHNLDTQAHTYQLAATIPEGWLALDIPETIELSPNTQQELFLTVQVPPAVPAGRYLVGLKAHNNSSFALGRVQVEVRARERLKLSLVPTALTIYTTEEKSLVLTVTNRGNVTLRVTVAVTAAPRSWQFRLRESSLTLAPSQSKPVELAIKPLQDAAIAPAQFTVQATSDQARDELSFTVVLSPEPSP